MSVQIIIGDALEQLRLLPSESVHCCVTSPPYFGLRDYGVAGQIGLESSPDEYVARLVDVFREVRRVLRRDGTVWLNLGDSYCAPGGGFQPNAPSNIAGSKQARTHPHATSAIRSHIKYGCKPKDLIGIPWMLAFALRADGWYLRQDIIWAKPNPMPESVTDRCTKAHEYVFLLSKSARYYYDANAIAEPNAEIDRPQSEKRRQQRLLRNVASVTGRGQSSKGIDSGVVDASHVMQTNATRNRRSVWTVASEPYSQAHFATYPPALIDPCILAGTSERGVCAACGAPWVRQTDGASFYTGDDNSRDRKTNQVGNGHGGSGRGPKNNLGASIARTTGWQPACACDAATVPATVLDPFGGSGTTGMVADRLGRNAILIELNPAYAELARYRIEQDAPLFAEVREPARAAMPIQELLL